MVQGGEDFGFASESRQALGITPDGLGQELDRDLALEGHVRGATTIALILEQYRRHPKPRSAGPDKARRRAASCSVPAAYGNLAYSARACLRTGMSGSAFFHSVKRSSYAPFALTESPESASARASCRRAIASMGSTSTMLR